MSCNCDENPLILPIGPQGEQGPTGPIGPQGITGSQGPIGLTGAQGIPGEASNSIQFSYNYKNTATSFEPGYSPNTLVGYFRFPGTTAFGTPLSVKAIVSSTIIGHNSIDIIITNVNSSLAIASAVINSDLTTAIIPLSIINPFPTTEAVFRIDLSVDYIYTPARLTLHSLDLSI